ncbi:MAG: hypothetical protein U1F42_03175 [Candidatus Competibacteraceae bacterium]
MLGLTAADQAVLCLAALLHGDRLFHRAIAEQSCAMPTRLLYRVLARLTGLPQEDFRTALSPTALLPATGLDRGCAGPC